MEKRILIDLGGCYPSKSKAVQEHAFSMGYQWRDMQGQNVEYVNQPCLFIEDERSLTQGNRGYMVPEWSYTELNAERFLEMTKEDVLAILKPEPKYVEVVRYRPIFKLSGRCDQVGVEAFKTIESCLNSPQRNQMKPVGYKEVKVWIKEDEL